VFLFPYSNTKLLLGSSSNTVLRIDITGVIPLPAAKAA
jgi:hypothetical protein